MIDRYLDPDIGAIFTERAQYQRWLAVEQAVLRAQAEIGPVPWPDAVPLLASPSSHDWDRLVPAINAREAKVRHDVEAFVQVMGDHYGDLGRRWLHFGLTSSDVVDTGLGLAIRDASRVVSNRAFLVSAQLATIADEYADWPAVARTHGQPAALTTVAHRARTWEGAINRARGFFIRAANEASVGQASGPVGDWSRAVTPKIEAEAMRHLHLGPMPYATQVVPRDLHVAFMFGLARLTGAAAKIATDLRLLTIAGEVTVPFEDGQVGSSSMPHKRNPIECEKIVGLDRLVRGYLSAEMESAALWLERDISHSSVERVAIPDALHVTCHALTCLVSVLARVEFPAPDVADVPDTYERTTEGVLAGKTRRQARDWAMRQR